MERERNNQFSREKADIVTDFTDKNALICKR